MQRAVRGALAVAVVVAVGWIITQTAMNLRAQVDRKHLPPMPDLSARNGATHALFLAADRALQGRRMTTPALQHLADLYLAHAFYPEASAVYRFLGTREPHAYTWPYLEGVADEAMQSWPEAEHAYVRATTLDDRDVDLWSRLSTLQLTLGHVEQGRLAASRAYALDPGYPPAAAAVARLAAADQDWTRVVEILEPVVLRYPRYSDAHKQLARALEMLGRRDEAALHREEGAFGDAVDPPMLETIYRLAVPALLHGNPRRGPSLVEERCIKCHTLERTFVRPEADLAWWAATVRRMQRLAGKSLLTDDEAADVAAYLASARSDTSTAP